MAFILVASTRSTGSNSGGTTPGINTSGSTLITLVVTSYSVNAAPTVSDNKGNTWNARTVITAGAGCRCRIYDCLNPTVGTGHTFTVAGTTTYSIVQVLAWSGANTTSSFDQENGAGAASGTSLSAGSVTPSENNELIVTGETLGGASAGETVASPMTLQNYTAFSSGNNMGSAIGYEIQTTATARNPSWSGGSQERAARVATYKAAAASSNRRRRILCAGRA